MSSTLQIRTLTEINEICFLYQRNMARSISVCQFLLFVIQYSTSNGHPRVGFVIISRVGEAPGRSGSEISFVIITLDRQVGLSYFNCT